MQDATRCPVPARAPSRHLAAVPACQEPGRLRSAMLRVLGAAELVLTLGVLYRAVNRLAPASMRRQAWAAGFGLALGQRSAGLLLSLLDEFTDGNERAHALRSARHDHRPGAVCCPFALPDLAAATTP
jgi:hypothetical protein